MDIKLLSEAEIEQTRVPPIQWLTEDEDISLPITDIKNYGKQYLKKYSPDTSLSELKRIGIEVSGGDMYAHVHYFFGDKEDELVIVCDVDKAQIEGIYSTKSLQHLQHIYRNPTTEEGDTLIVFSPEPLKIWILNDEEYQAFRKREIVPFLAKTAYIGSCEVTPITGGAWHVVAHLDGKSVSQFEDSFHVRIRPHDKKKPTHSDF